MKKRVLLQLMICLIFTLTACGSNTGKILQEANSRQQVNDPMRN